MNIAETPKTIQDYLNQVRIALGNADPALIQDALYDAEDHLRSVMAENFSLDEATLIAKIASSYGSPEEIAAIYLDNEVRVAQALRSPKPPDRKSIMGRFFGIVADPHTYGALFYMLLSLATGIFYFTWVVTGVSLSAGLSILIIGIPFMVLFLSTVRVLSLVEGRLVESMLGVRMPRRPTYGGKEQSLLARIKEMFLDVRTWSTLFYMVMLLPLGIVYFTLAVTGLSVALALISAPIFHVFTSYPLHFIVVDGHDVVAPLWAQPLIFIMGIVALFALLHFVRGLGHLHGQLAKKFLVKSE